MRNLKTIILPVLLGFGILAVVGLAGSSLMLYREAAAVHPVLGWLVITLLAAALMLLLGIPLVQVLRLPGALVRPASTTGPAWNRFVTRYARRLVKNQVLRTDYPRIEDLERALERKAKRELEDEVTRAIAHLDVKAEAIVTRYAASVFTTTAISQSGRLDTALVLSAQFRMVKEIATVYYQRPQARELWSLYANVGTAGFVAGEIQDSELLAVLGAPVTAGITSFIPVAGSAPLVSLLVNSLLDGSANAFLTLRIGTLARRYAGLRLEEDRGTVARSASLEAAGLLGAVVSRGAARLATLTRKLVLESATRGTARAAKGVAGAGVSLFEKIFGLAGKAGSVAADGAVEGMRILQESLHFWESIAGPEKPTEAEPIGELPEKSTLPSG
jgi:hypothetical protein